LVSEFFEKNPRATQQQCAKVLGISQPRVFQIINELLVEKPRKLNDHGGLRVGQADNDKLAHGTGKDYIIARLEKEGQAELAEKVKAGELSARKAGIEAGFIKKAGKIQCAATPDAVSRACKKRFTPDERQLLIKLLMEEEP
jgi:hypothetical protein